MQGFIEIAKTDFMATFEDSWIFPVLIFCIFWILWKEQDRTKKWLAGILPLILLVLYWCPITGILLMKILGENVYWRILWLVPVSVTIPVAFCLLLKSMKGGARFAVFLILSAVIVLGGKKVLSTEWFEPSTNVWKVPQNVVAVCDLLPGNVHVLASNRLTPYLRLYDPTLTLEYARNALIFNGMDEVYGQTANLYKAIQEPEIDVDIVGPLAREQGCTFLIFSIGRTYAGDWEDYGYREYASTDEFRIFVDEDYEEGQDTRKWED